MRTLSWLLRRFICSTGAGRRSCVALAGADVLALRENRTSQMAAALNATGRPVWLTFHCIYTKKGHADATPSFAPWCAQNGNSWRVGPDHHDNWGNLDEVIMVLRNQAAHGRPGRWNDPDFLMTGGAGCDEFVPGKLRKCLLLHPATPYYPSPRGKFHTRGNIWSFTVG